VGEEGDIQVVPDNAEREDSDGETIASESCITAEQLRDGFVVVFCVLLTESGDCGPLACSRG
jgi:hypothetical protein